MYHHTQKASWILAISVLMAIVAITFGMTSRQNIPPLIFLIGLAILVFLFSSLTVEGDNEKLSFHFGGGFFGRKIKYGDIKSVRAVRNKWYFGWGIRWFGKGWLYNVAGLDAVELLLKNGKIIRIGTDEPDELTRFIEVRRGPKN